MKIAIIGTGISGLTAAYLLHKQHQITVFEAADRIGGHTATVDVSVDGRQYSIDTGFIVFNDWTYPNFIKLMRQLKVPSQPTEMSFSVSCDASGLEYGGSNLNSLFSQRRNLLSAGHWKMLWDILRFNRKAIADLEAGSLDPAMTLGEYLSKNNYGKTFIDKYLVPMGSAIWSASTSAMLDFPLLFFVRFFKNHGLLSVSDRPQWRVIKGGSRQYLEPLTEGFKQHIRLSSPVHKIRRSTDEVTLTLADGSEQQFDQVIIASHSDQALAMLLDASEAERSVLSAIPYKDNEVILHTDDSLLPQQKLAWSSWNYWLRQQQQQSAVLTYNMNILQGIEAPFTFCVTLNAADAIDPEKILGRFHYSHPEFSLKSIAAADRWQQVNGVNRTWFCGAYWANGFHEDGVVSGIRVAESLGAQW